MTSKLRILGLIVFTIIGCGDSISNFNVSALTAAPDPATITADTCTAEIEVINLFNTLLTFQILQIHLTGATTDTEQTQTRDAAALVELFANITLGPGAISSGSLEISTSEFPMDDSIQVDLLLTSSSSIQPLFFAGSLTCVR